MKNNQIINGKEFDRNTGLGGSDATRIYEGDWHQLWSEKTGKSHIPRFVRCVTSTNGNTYRTI